MAGVKTLHFNKNIGGLNTRASDMMLESIESPDLLNVKLTKYGAIEKEKGYILYNDTAIINSPEVGGIYSYIKNSTDNQYIIVAAGTKLYTTSNGIFTDITRISSDYTNNTVWDFATFNNICIAVNGEDEPQKYSGGANAEDLGGIPPVGSKYIEIYQNRVFMAGETANPTKLSYSALSDPEDWTTVDDAGWMEVGLNDGQKIVGIKSFFDVLVVFKERSIYILSGSSGDPASNDYFVLEPINASIGAVSNRSIVQVGNDLYFLSEKGVYTLSGVQSYGDLNVSNISFKIQSLIDELHKGILSESFAINDYEEGRIWFFVAKGSAQENNFILIYDYNLNAWTKRSGFSSKCGLIFKDHSASKVKIYTGSYDGYIYYQKQTYNYNGSPIESYYFTPWLALTNYRVRKRVRDVQFITEPTGGFYMGVTYRWDFGNSYSGNLNVYLAGNASIWGIDSLDESGSIWDKSIWDAVSAVKTTKTLNGGGNVIQFKFWNSNKNEYFILQGWYINVIERGIR
ncbi:MAG: hypothetical protein AB1782_09075 [Cyanobacteriota bacterium]